MGRFYRGPVWYARNVSNQAVAESAPRIRERLRSAARVFLPLHRSPDGDSAGSALAMRIILERWGIPSTCSSVDRLPSYLQFLPGAATIRRMDVGTTPLQPTECLLCLDISAVDRFTYTNTKQFTNSQIINIDHHITNTRFGSENLVLPRSATAEILALLLDAWGETLTPDLATCLLTGITTDTGSFNHEVSPETLEISARLQRAGGDYNHILLQTMRSIPFAVYQLWGEIFRRTRLDAPTRTAWAVLPHTVVAEARVDRHDLHAALVSASNRFLRNIQGADIAFLCAEERPTEVHVSLRRRTGTINLGEIAQRFGGGGHPGASGFIVQGNPDDVARRVLSELARR